MISETGQGRAVPGGGRKASWSRTSHSDRPRFTEPGSGRQTWPKLPPEAVRMPSWWAARWGRQASFFMRLWNEIKKKTSLPVILFPSSVAGLCENADAVFFMSLLNSRSTSYIVENQAMGAPLILRYGLEPIPMAYIIIEPGGTVGFVGDARLIPRKKPELAGAYALAAKFMGMRLVYLEAGSGADSPVPVRYGGHGEEASGRCSAHRGRGNQERRRCG